MRLAATARRPTNPGASTASSSPCSRDLAQHLVALGPVAEDLCAQLRHRSRGQRATPARPPSPASRGCDAPRRRRPARRGRGSDAPRGPRRALDDVISPAMAELPEPPAWRREKQSARAGCVPMQPLAGPAEAPAEPTEVLPPVVAGPDLQPVDDELEPAGRRARARGEQREWSAGVCTTSYARRAATRCRSTPTPNASARRCCAVPSA